MKKILFAIAIVMMAITSASAQDFNMKRTGNGDASLASYERERLENLPYVQAYQASDGVVLKASDATGWGVELFGGANYSIAGEYFTPQAGLNIRYDAKKFSYRLGASLLSREYNTESDRAKQRYLAYAATAGININLFTSKDRVHVFALYAEGGYLFGKHTYKVGEQEISGEDGDQVIIKRVVHNGSGLVYGGGLEYRAQFFATGNALTLRAGYQQILSTFVNNTKQGGLVGIQLGWNFGIARNRTRSK